jgi:hypothetical protein
MNKLSAERILSVLQLALIPIALFVLLISIALDANAASDEKPSMELLEFLGEWQTDDGEWVDPMRFLNITDEDLESAAVTKVNANEDRGND